jgi:hypothetical protein
MAAERGAKEAGMHFSIPGRFREMLRPAFARSVENEQDLVPEIFMYIRVRVEVAIGICEAEVVENDIFEIGHCTISHLCWYNAAAGTDAAEVAGEGLCRGREGVGRCGEVSQGYGDGGEVEVAYTLDGGAGARCGAG